MDGVRPLRNILFLASWYPNKVEPQNGNFIQRHARAVAEQHRVASLHVLSISGVEGYQVEANWHQGIYEVIVYFDKTSLWLPLRKFNRYLKAHRLGFERVIQELGTVHLVHLNVFLRAGLFALELKRKLDIPFIVTEHWTAFLDSNPRRFGFLERRLILKIGSAASMICPVSADLKNALERFGLPGPFRVIPNVVDTGLFRVGEDIGHQVKKILHVSTCYDQQKNISGLLNVIATLEYERQDFKITLVGNKYGEYYNKQLKQLGISEGRVEIFDEVPIEEIARLMRHHQIFVLFSNYENLPCVIAEAHSSGMVVIATDVGGVREMMNPHNGILIRARDESELLNALNHVMDHLEEYDTSEISRLARQRYSAESVARQYHEVYTEILTK